MTHKRLTQSVKFVANYPNADTARLLSVQDRMAVTTSLTGQNVTIAFLDAGFYMHPDIRDRILVHVDATTKEIKEEKIITQSTVASWHGLMVSTIGAGNGRLSNGYYRGLASDSDVVLVKVSNPRLQVKEADILRGFKWLIKNHERFNIRIVNVSVGGDRVSNNPDHPLHDCVRELVEAGVVVVISSGNHGAERLVPPASAPEAIIVGGYDDRNSDNPDDWQPYHSNYGQAYDGTPKPDVIAPAEWLPSPILPETMVEKEARWLGELLVNQKQLKLENLLNLGYQDLNLARQRITKVDAELISDLQNRIFAHKLINKYYQYVDGTSVAAPIVSSTIALMLEANSSLTVEQIRDTLCDTAMPLGQISSQQQGAGAIQVDKAVKRAYQVSR